MTLDADDIDLVLSGSPPFCAAGLLACVEGFLTDGALACPFAEWRRHQARQRFFRSWLNPTSADHLSA